MKQRVHMIEGFNGVEWACRIGQLFGASPFCSAWPRLGLAAEIDKDVAILDYALDDRPSTGKGEVGGRLFPQRARSPLVPGELSGGKGLAARPGSPSPRSPREVPRSWRSRCPMRSKEPSAYSRSIAN